MMQSGYLAPITLVLVAGMGLVMPALGQDNRSAVDWTGFYAGIYGGYGLDRDPANSRSSVTVFPPGVGGIDVPATYTQQSDLTRVETLLGGIRAGANYQFNSFVMGVEGGLTIGDFGKASSSSLDLSATDIGPPPVDVSLTQSGRTSFTADAIGTLEGRIGWSSGNWLLFGKAGLAVAQGTLSADNIITVVGGADLNLPDGTFPSAATTTGLLFGASVGIGAEVFVTDNISVEAEYSIVHLAGQTVFLQDAFDQAPSERTPGDINVQMVKAGFNYHF